MKNRLVVAAVIRNGNKTLLGRKPKGKGPYPDAFHIPGGGININESAEDAILREIKEETGLDVKNLVKVAWDTDIEPDDVLCGLKPAVSVFTEAPLRRPEGRSIIFSVNKNSEETYYIFLQFACDLSGGTLQAGDDMHIFEWTNIKNLSKYNYNLNKPTKVLFKKLGYLK